MLSTPLGHSRLLARPGDRRLCLLDPPAAVLWDLFAQGIAAPTLAALLVERFGLAADRAVAQVGALIAGWRRAGLLAGEAARPAAWRLGGPSDPVWPRPRLTPPPAGSRARWVADRALSLAVADPLLGRDLDPWWAGPPERPWPLPDQVHHRLHLSGAAAAWRLTCDGQILATGERTDAALVAVLSAFTELGCRPAERLLVVHGAGLVQPDGFGLLLVAPGGSGKSTLAAALDAAGYGLLSDDVVPVTLDGDLLGLGLPLCLKAGSWPVLAALRPDLGAAPVVQRFGQPVRYLPPRTTAPPRPVTSARLVLSRWRPGAPLAAEPLSPEAALQGLVAAEAVFRDLTQSKLSALARWIDGLSAWRLTYPDLDQARAWLELPPAATLGSAGA